jgi:histidinol-phosphate aminotransferase
MRFSGAVPALPTAEAGYVPPADGVVKLNQNESPFGLAPAEWAELLAELAAVPLHRYPDPSHAALERAIAREAGLDPAMVLAAGGANEVLELLVRVACDPGDEVLTVSPTYPLYDRLCAVNRARLRKVPWGEGLAFPRQELLGAVSPRTRLILLCRPNNPTGHLYPAAEVLAVAAAFPGLVVVDEAYYDFCRDTVAPFAGSRENLAIVRTLSKAFGAAGLRAGYLLAAPEIAAAARAVQTPYGLGALSQAAALYLITHPALMERRRQAILAGREELARSLGALPGLTVLPSAANFLLVRTEGSADALDRHLRSRRIFVRNPHWQDRHLRISVGTAQDHAALMEAMRAFPTAG